MGAVRIERVEAAYRRVHGRLWRATCWRTPDLANWPAMPRPKRSPRCIATGMLADRPTIRPEPSDPPGVTALGSTVEFLDLLAGLSAQQRACITLRYVGGFTPTEIAGIIDTTPGTIRVQLHRAHASLRTTLSAEDSRQ